MSDFNYSDDVSHENHLFEMLSHYNSRFEYARTEMEARESYYEIARIVRELTDLGNMDWYIKERVNMHPIALAELF